MGVYRLLSKNSSRVQSSLRNPICIGLIVRWNLSGQVRRTFATAAGGGTDTETARCWRCQKLRPLNALFCPQQNCGIVQPASKQNYYQLFSMPVVYDIDIRKLESSYRSLHRRVHPDKFSTRPKDEQDLSTNWASVVNQGFAILKDPILRAKYLLSLKGVKMDDERDKETNLDELAEILEIREQIEKTGEAGSLPVQPLIDQRFQALVKKITDAFKRSDLETARKLTMKLGYWRNMQLEIQKRQKGQ